MVYRDVYYTNATGTKLFSAAPLRIAFSVRNPPTNTAAVLLCDGEQRTGKLRPFRVEPGETLFISAYEGYDLNKDWYIEGENLLSERICLQEEFAEDMVLKVVRDNGFSNLTSLPLIIIAGAIALGGSQ